MIFPSALNYPEECESLSAERFGSATDPGEPTGYARPYDHNGFKNPWHLAHGRVPGPGDPVGRRYPDDRIGGRGSTGLHGAQRPGRDHLGGTPLGERTLRYPRLPANAPRPRTSSRARDTGKIPVVQHSTPKKPLSGPKTALSAAQPGPPSTKHGFRDTAHSHHPFSPTHPCRCSRFVHHRKHRQPASRTYPPSSEN